MKNQDIERLRGIAIFSVLTYHLSISRTIFDIFHLKSNNSPFYLGVELFFLISGYVVTRSFASKKLNLKLFYLKRIFRILPLIIVFLILTTFLNFFKTFCTVPWDIFILDAFAVLGSYLINYQHGVYYNGAMWSLSVEMQFYLIFPLVLTLFYKIYNNQRKSIITTLAAIYLVISVILRTAIAYREVLNYQLSGFLYHIAHWKFDFLILGTIVYFSKPLNLANKNRKTMKLIAFLFLLLPIIISYKLGSDLAPPDPNNLLYTVGYLLIGICFYIVLKIASLDKDLFRIHSLIDRFIEYMGSRSYSIYVLHFPSFVIIWMIINQFFPAIFHMNPMYYGITQALLFIIIGIPMAEISFRYIEQPAIRIGESMINKYKVDKELT